MPNIPLALVPGHIGAQSDAEIRRNILEVTTQQVIDNLTRAPAAAGEQSEPGPRDIVVKGGFREVNRYFYEHELSDGLPIVPPTREEIESFLRFTGRDPDEILGVLLPDRRAATIWSVAVNGVMAGCRPEYMPILIAAIEAMCDPEYGVEHSGNTPGGDTLIILNGPIIKQLGFNYTQGAMRDGFLPNTAVGRFWRLYLRNGLKLGKEHFVAAIALSNVWATSVPAVSMARFDLVGGTDFVASLLALIPAFAGLAMGQRLRGCINEDLFRKVLAAVLFLIGLNLMRKALG